MPLVVCPDCATRQYVVASFVADVRCVCCGALLASPKDPRFGGWRRQAALRSAHTELTPQSGAGAQH